MTTTNDWTNGSARAVADEHPPQRAGDDAIQHVSAMSDRADCCSAQPMFRIIVPTPSQPSRGELQLCGHHTRSRWIELLSAGAIIRDSQGRLV